MALTREQKGELAALVIQQVANVVEFWGEREEDLPAASPIKGLSNEAVREQIALWMDKLPGTGWDIRLDAPGV